MTTAPADRTDPVTHTRRRDDAVVKGVSLLLIGAVIALTVSDGAAAAGVIDSFRTWVTRTFSWYFVLLATLALVFCLFMAFSRRGHIVLGGPGANREYGNFAWYSMLFACGQGVGLIFWSVAEPIMVLHDNPLAGDMWGSDRDAALVWTYFHWSVHAWAIYCLVALCLALSFHNRGAPMTFRDAVVGVLPARTRRPVGLVVEVVAILATVFGLSTSFAFAAMQISSGLQTTFGLEGSATLRTIVIVVVGLVSAVSVYIGVDKGMKRISESNTVLSVVLLVLTLVFGPTLYILAVVPETLGQYGLQLVPMGLWADANGAAGAAGGPAHWSDSWVGTWTLFIWAWCWAFSPFVGSFIARISRGRSVREFVVGVLAAPSLICVVWIGIIGSTALEIDERTGGEVTRAVGEDVSMGLFAALEHLPVAPLALAVATILVGTYFITSLDSGVHALAGFAASAARPSALFRTGLVLGIAVIAFLLLGIGGEAAVGTVQTGTILGALPYTVVVMAMTVQATRHCANPAVPDASEQPLEGREGHGSTSVPAEADDPATLATFPDTSTT